MNKVTLSVDERNEVFAARISTFKVECTSVHTRRLCIVDHQPIVYDKLVIKTKDVDGVECTVYDSEEEIVDGVPHTIYKYGNDVWEEAWINNAGPHYI